MVGVFLNEESPLRVVGSVLMDINEERVAGKKIFDHAEGMIRQEDGAQINYRKSETLPKTTDPSAFIGNSSRCSLDESRLRGFESTSFYLLLILEFV